MTTKNGWWSIIISSSCRPSVSSFSSGGCITLVVVVLNPMRIDPYPRELRLCGLIEFAGIELFNHHHQQQDRNMSRKVTITITHHTTPADYHLDGLSNFNGLIGGIEKDGRWKRIANIKPN